MIHNPTDKDIFPDLDLELLAQVRQFGESMKYAADDWVVREGDSPYDLFLIQSGEVRASRRIAGIDTTLVVHKAGEFTGDISLLYTSVSNIALRALTHSELTRVPADRVRELLARHTELAKRIVMAMTNRVVDAQFQIRHREKMAALSTLAAGLAHELGNPLSVIMRSHSALERSLDKFCQHIEKTGSIPSNACEELIRAVGTVRRKQPNECVDALTIAAREEELYDWLEERGIEAAAEISSVFVAAGLELQILRILFPEQNDEHCLDMTLATMNAVLTAQRAILQTSDSSDRMQRVVSSVKSYTDMDRAPWREVDIHEGLNATLDVCGARLSEGIEVIREFDPSIPSLVARPAELNQVWTNLIDNASLAMGTKGKLRIQTVVDGDSAVVEFLDTGCGVPPEVLGRIFEPFFTTRDVGQGLGLGLHTAHTIVVMHHGGAIHVSSMPGRTSFRVHLPLKNRGHELPIGLMA